MKKFIVTSIVLFTISILPGGCCWDSCCGESFSDPGKINVLSMAITFEELSINDSADANGYLAHNRSKFNINVLDYEYTRLASLPHSKGLNLAYACSPPEPAPDVFLCFKVYSDEAVSFGNNIIQAGADLSEYFQYYEYFNEDGFYIYYYSESFFNLVLAPSDTINQNFEFELEMDDGEIFNLPVENVKILPN